MSLQGFQYVITIIPWRELMLVFLFRPSLRRLVARIRAGYPESIVFDDTDRQVVTSTFDACRSITLISKYLTRTVSYVRLSGCEVLMVASSFGSQIVVNLGSNFLWGSIDGGASHLVRNVYGPQLHSGSLSRAM